MYRLMNGPFFDQVVYLVRVGFRDPHTRILFPMADTFGTNQRSLALSHNISPYPLLQLQSYSIRHHRTFALCQRQGRVHQLSPFNDFHDPSLIQRRTVSELCASPKPQKDSGKEFIIWMKNLAKRIGWIRCSIAVGAVISVYVAVKESGPRQVPSENPSSSQQPQKIQEMIQFVQHFNETKATTGDTDDMLSLQDQAFSFISDLRSIGGLSPRRSFNIDEIMAKKGFQVLVGCHDVKIQREALKYLLTLLKRGFNSMDDAAKLWELEAELGNMIIKAIDHERVPIIEEMVTAYSLIIEQIFLHGLYSGANQQMDKKWGGVKRSKEIGKALGNNLVFQYQAQNARVIAESLEIPSKPVTETIKAIYELMPIFTSYGMSVEPLLKSDVYSLQFWQDLIQFTLSTSPVLASKVIDVFERLKLSFTMPETASPEVFSLRPCYIREKTNEQALKSFCDSVNSAQQYRHNDTSHETDWVYLYRVVDVLSEILFSSCHTELRMNAFNKFKDLLNSHPPREVLCKMISTLISLKEDPLFSLSAEELLDSHRAVIEADPKLKQEWTWFNKKNEAYQNIDRVLNHRYRYNPETDRRIAEKLNMSVFKSGQVISRKDVFEKVIKEFQSDPSKTIVQAIIGGPGKGKTTFVIEYLLRFGRDYTFVFWVDARTFEEDLAVLAEKKGIPDYPDIEDKLEELQKYLCANPGWLLIIDNVENSNKDKIHQFFPENGGHILMTGRSLLKKDWPGVLMRPLDNLSLSESIYLLTHGTELTSKEDLNQAGEIAEQMGNLPLALTQARAYITSTLGMSFRQYSHLYKDKTIKLSEIMLPINQEDQSVYTTWSVNIDQVRQENQIAAELISFLSFVYPGEISFLIIEKWQQNYAPSLNLHQIFGAIRTLAQYVMLEEPSGKEKGSIRERSKTEVYQIHPLNQEISRRLLSDQDWVKYLEQAIVVLTDLDDFQRFNPVREGTHKAFEDIRQHFEALFEIIHEDFAVSNKLHALDTAALEKLQYLVNTIGRYHLYIGRNFELAEKCFDDIAKIAQILGSRLGASDDADSEAIANKSRLYQGWSYYLQGLLKLKQRVPREAAPLFKLAEQEFNQVDESTFDTHLLESNKEKWNKTYALAICQFEEMVAKGYSNDHLEESYQEFETLKRKFETAAAEGWERLKAKTGVHRPSSGEDVKEEVNILRFDVPRCLREQAKIRSRQKNYPEARQLMKLVIKQQKKMYRATPDAAFDTSPALSVSYHELAEICYQGKDYPEAIKYEEKSLKINRKIYKSDNHTYVKRNLDFITKCQTPP